ncbi:NAD(P) transhydrogenase subunit alpha [Niveispirillum sp. KHB5.9]|uniref:NAD(P) transhydrogenase subunit alpha n=1 Tax=Niveispirillum sp. KHB5.9 TaxID=3400269 RepID=UPI003A870541
MILANADSGAELLNNLDAAREQAVQMTNKIAMLEAQLANAGGMPFIVIGLTVFVLACFVGYYVVWKVTPALHSPLMAVTNAVSSVIIVGALIATGAADNGFSALMGFLAIVLASVNIFGGFMVTQRMLSMYKKKAPSGAKK